MQQQWDVLVLDLDGTLLSGKGEVPDQNIHALDAVRDAGIEVVVATGRSFDECKHILNLIQHQGISITAGGSALHDAKGVVLDRETLSIDIVEEVSKDVVANNHRCLLLKDPSNCDAQYVLVGDAQLHHASSWWFETLKVPYLEVKSIEDDPWPSHTLRVGAVAEEAELKPIAERLEKSLQDRAKMQHWSAVTCSEATGSQTHLLEVFKKDVNKWSMLKRHHGKSLNPKRVIAIGDGINDIELFQEVGLSIVMGNATLEVQSFADVIAGRHDGNGFAEAMQRWVIPAESKQNG